MLIRILTLLAIITAAIQIRAEYLGPRLHVYIFKPLTMIFILVIAFQGQADPVYRVAILAGLGCSLVGDILLMLPDHFVAGLIAFLVAHLFYIAVFALGIGLGGSWWSLAILAIYGLAVYRFLAPALGAMKVPVIAYIVVILVMTWQAWARWSHGGQSGALLAFVGAILFVISDTILAANRFRGPYRPARALNLISYFVAQWLIASSVGS